MRFSVTLAAMTAAALFTTVAHAQAPRTSRGVTPAGAPTASAQAGQSMPIELGLDGVIAFGLDDPQTTSIQLPVRNFRIGFMRDPVWSIEPFMGLSYTKQGDVSLTQLNLGTGLLYHFSTSRAASQWYARPFLGLDHTSISADNNVGGTTTTSANQFQLGGGVGIKVPMADRFGLRFELALAHDFKSGDLPSSTTLAILGGFSFYTR